MYVRTNPEPGARPLTRFVVRRTLRRGLGDAYSDVSNAISTAYGDWAGSGGSPGGVAAQATLQYYSAVIEKAAAGNALLAQQGKTQLLALLGFPVPTKLTTTSGTAAVKTQPPAFVDPLNALNDALSFVQTKIYNMATGQPSPAEWATLKAQCYAQIHQAAAGNADLEAQGRKQCDTDISNAQANAPGFGGGGAGDVNVPTDYTPYVILAFIAVGILIVVKS